MWKRFSRPFSRENMPPRPGTTSSIRCVCFQTPNCDRLMLEIGTAAGAEMDVAIVDQEVGDSGSTSARSRRSSRPTGGT